MALLPWNSEDDNKDNLFQPQPIKKIASVQSGSWQPAASGADSAVATDDVTQGQSQQGGIFGQTPTQQPAQQSSTPYLVSQEKAQVDQAKRQRDAEIEQARIEQEQARQRAEAAAEVSKQFQEGKATDQNGQQFDVEALKNDNGWKKYYDDAFKKEKDSLDFWGRLMDGGQASKRAEVNARLKYNNELLQRAYDDNGNVINPEAAAYSKKVAAYNSALAQDNSTRSRALGEAIGAFDKPGEDGGFVHRLRNAINAEKQMSIYDAIVGADDSQKTDINDVGRFAGGLVQGIGTMPVIGGKELVEAGTGRGTDEATGFEKDLTAGERIGRGVSGGLNVVTPFIGGSGKLLDSLTTKVLTDTATAAEKTLLKQLTAKILLPAIEQGGIGVAQAGAEYFGNGQTLLDENGEFDKEKLLQFAKETGTAGAMGVAGGALLSGGAMGVTRLRNRGDVTPVTRAELADMETRNTNSAEAQISQNRANNGELGLQALERGEVTPVREPVVEAPAADVTPIAEKAPVEGADITPVADGVVNSNVRPVRDDITPVGTDEVRALQEARAGTTQAEEAAINQKLQEIDSHTPKVEAPQPTVAPQVGDTADDAILIDYAGNGYSAINNHVRGRTLDKMDAPIRAKVQAIDSRMTENIPSGEYYRGMVLKDSDIEKMIANKSFTNDGYSSVSDSLDGATRFTHTRSFGNVKESPVIFKLTVPEGQRGIDLTKISGESARDGEKLLPRGATYKVNNITKDGDKYVVSATFVDDVAAPKPEAPQPTVAPVQKPKPVDPTAALKAEALKYKSAEEFTQHLGRQKAAGDPATTALLSDMSSKAQKLIDGGMSSKAAANRVFNDTFDTLRLQPENYKTLDEFINAQGKPLYHGTDANFDRYSLGNFGKTDQGFTGKGIYLSGRKGNARQYGKNVVESYANLKNPLEYTDSYSFGAFSPDGLRARLGLPPKASAEEVTAALKSRGHDGVVIHEDTGTGIRKNEEVVVLDPTQVRTKQQLTDLYNQAHTQPTPKPEAPQATVAKVETPQVGKTLKDGELYSTTNSYVSFGSDSTGGVISYKPKSVGSVPERISYNKLSQKTRDELVSAELEYKNARANSTTPVAPGTVTEVQIAKRRLEVAQSNAIEELGLQEHASIEGARLADGTKPTVQKPFLDRYTDWLENKWKSKEYSDAQIQDMEANPSKYKAQFESETSSNSPEISQLQQKVDAAKADLNNPQVDSRFAHEQLVRAQRALDEAQAHSGKAIPENVAPVKVPNLKDELNQTAKERILTTDEKAVRDTLNEKITPADNVPEIDVPADPNMTPHQFAERFMPKLASAKETKKDIANAVDMGKDVESSVREILAGGNVKPKKAERIAKQYDKFDKQLQEYNRLTEQNQKAYAENGIEGISEETSRANRRAGRELGITMRRLQQEIKRLDISGDRKEAFFNGLANMLGSRNASVLTSAGLIERNIFQEMTANAKLAIKNPIKMTKSTLGQGNILKDTAKAELSHWGDVPRSASEVVKYVVGNTYRTAMIPTTALANTRRGAVRQELTKWAAKELQGIELSGKDAKKLSGTAGNEMEALVNTFIGVDNGMTNRGQAMDAIKAWKEYMKTGDDASKAQYLERVERHNSLASKMINGVAGKDQAKLRSLKALGDLIFPFVRTVKNLATTTVQQDLNPFARSLLDEIRVDQRSGGANTINLIKSKLVDYGIMSGAAALASSGAIVYNDGDQVDKPKGWSIKVGDNQYIPVRATSLELPIAIAGAGQVMFNDIAEGNARDWKYYSGMITGSLPYIDQFNTTSGAVDSMVNGEDAGYAAKAYTVNTAKGFVPFSNNGVQAYAAGKSGESLNAKSVYDDNLMTWFTNTVRKSYDPDFYNSLKDSRDNAGRVRTVDNQGVISNKTMNDEGTREFNDRITDLVDYGREAGLGENTKDMFNSYDTGKNNNFKSIQDAITFLDAEDGKPDNTKKLEKNAKYTDLAQQIRDGFFGESGDELLTLDGKNLYSDVSVPNGAGSKNSRLPMNMQSIKNAIAQTDLPADQRDRIKELSDSDSALYARLKSKEITYEQYSAEKAKTGQEYIDILSNSENYKKMTDLFDELDESGFFEPDGLGSTRSGQTYLWNSLNALLGSKGATPAANYPKTGNGFTPWGNRGTGRSSNAGGNLEGGKGVQFTPVTARQLAAVKAAQFTPFKVKVKLGNEIKRDRSQNYSDRSF